jgi:hypothetical protein
MLRDDLSVRRVRTIGVWRGHGAPRRGVTMARKKRQQGRERQGRIRGGRRGARKEVAVGPERRPFPDWRWRTFPVFFAFVVGLLVASFINGRPSNSAAAAVQLVALAGVGYGVAHLFVTNVIVAGRLKRRREAEARGETPAEDIEEELVYEDERSDERQAPGR